MGPNGPKPEYCDGQGERIQDLRINMPYLCCTKIVDLKGLLCPNENFFTKTVSGNYWVVDGKQTIINIEFQHLRIDSGKVGIGRAPSSCVIPYLTGPKQGSSALVYWDDSKRAPPPNKGVKHTTDGPISELVNRPKGEKAAYWMKEYIRCNMGLIDSCRKSAMRCFDEVSRVDMEESTWCPRTLEVNNKWLNKGSSYHDNADKHFKELRMNIDECLDSLFIEGINKVQRLEKEEMVKEVMAAEGVTADEENKTTRLSAASVCTGVTNGSTTGTVAKAMAEMNGKEAVMEEKKKRAAAQQAASTLHTKIEELKKCNSKSSCPTGRTTACLL